MVDFLFERADVTDRPATRDELQHAIEAEEGHVHGPGCGHDHGEEKPKKKAAPKKAKASDAAPAEAAEGEEKPAKKAKAKKADAEPAAEEAPAPKKPAAKKPKKA